MATAPIEQSSPDDRRAQNVALIGLLLQAIATAAFVGLTYWSKSYTLTALARFAAAGVPIWFALFLIYKQVRRVTAERLESTELKHAREAGTSDAIFDLEDEELLIEQNRLRWLVRWLLPAVTVLLSLYLLLGHFLFWGWSLDNALRAEGVRKTENPTMIMWFVVFIGLACFLFARYSLALARTPNWRLLHAGGIFIAATGLVCLGEVIALMTTSSIGWSEPVFAYILRVGMLLLGIELVGNFMLDFYRPRVPGVVARPSFDSRLLGLVGEPGALAKSIAEAVNYQFGFEVSSTWFYQLLQRWLFPIMVLTFFVVLALSSVVIVDADEAAVVEHYGRPMLNQGELLQPGFHLKWPFPIDVVHRAPVRRVQEVIIGEATEKEQDKNQQKRAILWTETHEYVPELMLLVASPRSSAPSLRSKTGGAHLSALKAGLPGLPSRGGTTAERILDERMRGTEAVPVSLVMVSMPIEYRIKDVKKYLYNYEDPIKLMEAVAYQYLSDYAAGVDIDDLMGPGRERINATLKTNLQERLDRLDLGLEIVFAGIRAAHPPAKDSVAETFQRVITANTSRATTIQNAEGEARRILTSTAGTEERAHALDDAVRRRDRLRSQSGTDGAAAELAEVEREVNDLLLGSPSKDILPMSGRASAIIADARASSSRRISQAAAKARSFSTEVAAYEAAPDLYKERKTLEMYSDIADVRKYLIVADPSKVIIEYQTQQEGGLDRVLGEGVANERKGK